MKIEAITVCVGYADFLAHTLLFNKRHFDRLVIVTDTADEQTRKVCSYHHVQCLSTDVFYENDHAFNKGKGINAGLAVLDKDGWVAHLDADIALPPRAKDLLAALDLDIRKLYGIDRMMCDGFDAWLDHLSNPEVQHDQETFVKANAFPLGSRLAWTNEQGYLPIGFFQLWHPKGSRIASYPIEHGEAARADVQFSMNWKRPLRELLAEIVAIHIDSQPQTRGINWRGRRTRPFTREGCHDPCTDKGFITPHGYGPKK